MIFLVSYDLKIPGKNYSALYEVIKGADGWWHHLDSTWVIRTNESLEEWTKKLNSTLDASDRLLIVDISKAKRNGWLTKKAWDWLRENDV